MTETEPITTGAEIHAQEGSLCEARAYAPDAPEVDQGTRDGAATPGARPAGAHTHACGQWWTGTRTAHCGQCHRTLSSITAFDRHQRGKPGGGVECLDPASVGLVPVEKPYGVLWACPSNGGGNPHARGGDGWVLATWEEDSADD